MFFFFQAEDGIRDLYVTGVQTCALPISRRLDRETGEWADHERLFATVTCWRAMAQNVAQSLKKGQPVVATGRFYSREYTKDEVSRMSYELDASAGGHDLSRGI